MKLSAKLLSRIRSYSKVLFDHFDRFLPSFLLKIDEPTNSIYKKSEIWPAGIQKILNVPWKKALRSFFNGHLVQVQRTPLFNILKQSFYKYLLVVSSILLSFYTRGGQCEATRFDEKNPKFVKIFFQKFTRIRTRDLSRHRRAC